MAVVSQALQRVLAHKRRISPSSQKKEPTMEGIYLSKLQLKTLGEQLISMSSGPDGLCFMIGVGNIEGKPFKTIEAIPYKNIPIPGGIDSREIYNNNIFRINAGGLVEDSLRDLIFDSNGHHKELKHPAGNEQISQGSQRTPPPFS
jgi:hypothetical protein